MVSETDSEYRIEMSLPGYRKQELSMSVEKGYLTVTSNPVSDGRIFGSQKFNKRFRIPSQVDTDSISAEYKDGVLVISIPKSRTSMKTSVTIK
jgi:HSP20 family protein